MVEKLKENMVTPVTPTYLCLLNLNYTSLITALG